MSVTKRYKVYTPTLKFRSTPKLIHLDNYDPDNERAFKNDKDRAHTIDGLGAVDLIETENGELWSVVLLMPGYNQAISYTQGLAMSLWISKAFEPRMDWQVEHLPRVIVWL